MADLVRFTVGDNGAVVVEVDESASGIGPVSRRDGRIHDVHQAFERQLEDIRDASVAALEIFRKNMSPDEIKLTFGVKLTAQVGAIIARTAVEGNLGVELIWKRSSTVSGMQ